MSAAIDDGGPAFAAGYHPNGNSADQSGMTLRDWFAGQAMIGMLASPNARNWCAEDSYVYADAMIAARNK